MKSTGKFGINVYTEDDAKFVFAMDKEAKIVNIKPFEGETIEQFFIEKMKITDVVSHRGINNLIFSTGIFIDNSDFQKFIDMSVADRVAFYATAIGDENLEGFAIIVQYIPESNYEEKKYYVYNNHMPELPNMRWLALSCTYLKVSFKQLSEYLNDGKVRGKEVTISDFFDRRFV